MNGKQVLILKQALDQIVNEIYKEIPLTYADKANKIIKNVIKKTMKKYFRLFE